MTDEEILAALRGRPCEGGCATRTRNPSRRCVDCLGGRACGGCRGSGQRLSPGGFPAGCGDCGGTGVR